MPNRVNRSRRRLPAITSCSWVTVGWADTAEVLAWLAGIPGLVLSLYAAALYVPLARRALAEGKADRLAQGAAG